MNCATLHAIEEKRFYSLGSDIESSSNFSIICGTNTNLFQAVREGRFREDLLARINFWTFELPGLKDRPEDLAPNIAYELQAYEDAHGTRVQFNKEAWTRYIEFAQSDEARWSANFRDLNASTKRMCALDREARITVEVVAEEIGRLKKVMVAGNRLGNEVKRL